MATPEGRPSMGAPMARLSLGLNGDDDALDLMAITDGFRPGGTGDAPPQLGRRSLDRLPTRPSPPRPSSITKPGRIESFALQHDGAMGHATNTVGGASSSGAATVDRSSSVSTRASVVRSESSSQNQLGPSHPYAMYPQQSQLARTESVATSSTVPIPSERSYTGPHGPAHPYMMYPQNTVPVADDTSDELSIPPMPVGFPGRNADYRRRLGPDGEEVADIIGPDGHTEQLPPYTLYSDEAVARKTMSTIRPSIPGAGGMGLATRNPEFASRDDLDSPRSRQSTRSPISISDSPETSLASAGRSEKPKLRKWQVVARRRVCGIVPLWAIILAALVLVMFAIILGTVLALLKPKHPPKHGFPPSQADSQSQAAPTTVYATMTTTFDATPCTTMPSGASSLATGTFGLPIGAATLAQSGCILNSAENSCWSCSMPQVPLEVSIATIPDSNPLMANELTISRSNETKSLLQYGAQPPKLSRSQILSVVTDNQEPERGPAWFFQIPYNKIVNLPERALTPPETKRDVPFTGLKRRNMAQPGDRPWICYWNGTLLEMFIYVNQTSTSQSSTTSSTAPAPTGNFSDYDPPHDEDDLQPYPNVVKVEERRIPRGALAVPPYCVQQLIDQDGTPSPIMNSTDQPVTIYLNETEPTMVAPMTGSNLARSIDLEEADMVLDKRQSTANCGCVWIAN